MSSNEWVPRYALSDGTEDVDPGRLWQIRGGWAEPHPIECPNGHRLGANHTLRGWRACQTVGGHRTDCCRQCGAVIYTPPVTDQCRHRGFDSR